jgi:hypothetical protein
MSDIISMRVKLPCGKILQCNGREAWTLAHLIEAGSKGITPIERPAPRWSHYVMCLRRQGLVIETIRIPHGGAFSGHHGRYVLHTPCQVLKQSYSQQGKRRAAI